ncbi:MAG TPA: UDP-N-acetylmuramoyl-tripeptide--D-alanyl-D-alanine ligase [Pyrinomonadaceae bacterium]|nr:UDP-N-acetylmuramoyl-tripeptide--D-alanyl-D-alanine ligase [Pyrinomonadaceae bacterium]
MKLETVIEHISADASALDPALLQREVGSFAIDSREIQSGDVFFALSEPEYSDNGFNGDFVDSTPYALSAFAAGAAACVVRPDRFREHIAALAEFENRLLFVADSIVALQQLAHGVYREWNKPVVAITGSAGKTTAKELTAHVLASTGRKVLKNIKNYNNGLGHPLTVLKLAGDKSFDTAVLEMGMSTPMNEIRRLCCITPPDVAVVLNVLPVHLEHLGSIENIALAKQELIEGMREGGTAVLNADDPNVAAMAGISKGRTITFGIENDADIMASELRLDRLAESRFALSAGGQRVDVSFPLSGRHNILNALSAAAVGYSFGIPLGDIAVSLRTVRSPPQRGEVLTFADGFIVINDSYNSNPNALIGMVKTLVDGGAWAKRKIVVAGEMLELGTNAALDHYAVGREMPMHGVDVLIGVRGLAKEMVRGARESGLADARLCENSDEAGELLAGEVRGGDLILVKGSRGVKTEKVIEKLFEKFELEEREEERPV